MKVVSNHIEPLFEENYLAALDREKRLYSDEELLQLPSIAEQHPHYREWKLRKESADRLKKYLSALDRPLKILELGSGNGWLSHFLATIPGSELTGVDINLAEFIQAQRVFHQRPNLNFVHGDIQSPAIASQTFDCILFAASLQYFSSPRDIISYSLQKLNKNGELHILDTNFYKKEEIGPAKKRTAGYFNSLGVPELTGFYFHHSLDELDPFAYTILYQPSFFNRHILQYKNPFPWIRIKRKAGA